MRPCLRPRHVHGNQACAGRGLSKGGAYNTTCRPTGVSTHFKLHFAQLHYFQGASSAHNYLAPERHHTSKSAHVSTCAFASIRLSSLDNLTSAYRPRCRAVYRTMPCVDRHALQGQAIQVFDLCRHDGRPAPLQIRSFTSDSYNAIKARERKKEDERSKVRSRRQDNSPYRLHHGEADFETSWTYQRAEAPSVSTLRPADGAQGLLTPASPSASLISRGPGCAGHVTGTNQACDKPFLLPD